MNITETPIPEHHEIPHKKPHNAIWWVLIILVIVPALILAWNTIAEPSGNRIYYGLDRPDFGVGFDIDKAEFKGEDLKMTVTYKGGCSDHNFDLYVENQQSDVNRTVTVHHSSDDTCTTQVTEDIKFNLSKTIADHKSAQVIFSITGNGREPDPLIYIKPTEVAPADGTLE